MSISVLSSEERNDSMTYVFNHCTGIEVGEIKREKKDINKEQNVEERRLLGTFLILIMY